MKGKIMRDDFLENHILTNLKMNEDEKIAAFMVNKACIEKNDYCRELWISRFDSQNMKRLNIEGEIKDFVWNKQSLTYLVRENGRSTFYEYNLDTDEATELLSIGMDINRFFLIKDKLLFTSTFSLISRTENVLEGSELPFYCEGRDLFSDNRERLYEYDMKSQRIEAVTQENLHIDDISINREQSKVVFIGYDIDGYKKIKSSIYLLDIESKKHELISSENTLKISYVEILDSNTVIFTGTDLKTAGRNENQEIYLIDIVSKKQIRLTSGFDKSNEEKAVVTDAKFCKSRDVCVYNNELYFLIIEEKGSCIYKINKDGVITKLSRESGTIDSYAVGNGFILFIGMRGDGLQEIYYLKDDKETKLTGFNDWLLENRIISSPEYMAVEKEDGTKIDGWIVKPVDYRKGEKYPGVLNIHGGPKMIFTDIYAHEIQILAAKGYFVFFCNPRGSDGKGNEFADIRGNFSSYAYEDLMIFTDKVLEKYQEIDENNLGVMGGSYGGYMTNYIIGQTTRFGAAVSERGISNLISTFSTSDIGYQYTPNYMEDSNPWNNMKTFIEESPLTYADRVKTPTLFIHGKNDHRCHYTESFQMYSAIRYFGVKAKICIFEKESHSLPRAGKPMSKIKRYDEIIKWFDEHLKKER
ncbi:S9 family peptidase [Wukongibacter baidiensis]|uniref:alpha/beta hydrolase family protein n=1 Tax=Wukongibacter baidiensis TaxID=1723361 RepID=UPI003D7FE73A